MTNKRVLVRVPASTANLGPGFDTLGMALKLYAWIDMSLADKTEIRLLGDNMRGVPTDKTNLIYQVAQQVFAEAGMVPPELHIVMYSDIPLTRGLGSSASAIVGALVAANALAESRLSQQQLFDLATAREGHPDNVGASLFGGIIAATWDGHTARHIRLAPPAGLRALAAIPSFELSTTQARHALPERYEKQDAVFNISHCALLVAALASGSLELIRHAMQDRIHQPYRAALVPGMAHILAEAPSHGALGAALSGAGPTLLALVDRAEQKSGGTLEAFLRSAFAEEGVEADYWWLEPEPDGPQLEWLADAIAPEEWLERIKGEVKA